MISVREVVRWSVASNDRALANARTAATECSRRRVERAEVEEYLSAQAARYSESTGDMEVRTAATGR